MTVHYEETFLDVGLPLCLCRWVPTDPSPGPPVLVLHGFLEQGFAWDAVARALVLALGREVVAPDHRGHGRSGHVGPAGFYHFWDYVGDVAAVVEHLGGSVDLVGHSMGGTMAVLYAGSCPESVRRLALLEGFGPPDLEEQAVDLARAYLRSRRRPPRHPLMADAHAAAERMRRYNPSLDPKLALALAERTLRATEGGETWAWDPLHRSRSPVPFQRRLFIRFLQQIRCPVLRLDGSASSYAHATEPDRPAAVADLRTEWIEGAGHLMHHDAPTAVSSALARHFSATMAPASRG